MSTNTHVPAISARHPADTAADDTASTHSQRTDDSNNGAVDGMLIHTERSPAQDVSLATGQDNKKKKRKQNKLPNVTMKDLVDEKILEPGPRCLEVHYLGTTTYGDLNADGSISHGGKLYQTPSAFSLAVKRLVKPSRQSDDGWKSVKYNPEVKNKFTWDLHYHKREYCLLKRTGPWKSNDDEPAAKQAKVASSNQM